MFPHCSSASEGRGGRRSRETADVCGECRACLRWIQATKAGINVERLLERLTGRVRGVHLRDYALYRKFVGRNPANYALGDGVLDFNRIIDAAKACGVDYGAIEQNTKHPYSEIAKSVAHVQAIGYGEDLK